METGIGAVLREARNRRKIDLSEVEAATQIRVRYLRAIENEEWDVLPGSVYTRGFIRTYAAFLGIDGERLADDFRRTESAAGERQVLIERAPVPKSGRGLPRIPASAWALLISAGLIAAIVVVGLSGGDDSPVGTDSERVGTTGNGTPVKEAPPPSAKSGVSVELVATAEVWVCVLNAKGRHLVDGQILESGATEGPFRSGSFTLSFGNGEVSMHIDGKQADIPATSSPIGYEIGSAGQLTELSDAERPSCI